MRREPGEAIPGDIARVDLTSANEGQTVAVPIPGEARLRLQTIGPGQFEKPTLTGSGAQFEDAELQSPPNPGGPTQIYVFRCTQSGTTEVSIPHSASGKTFSITLVCT